MIFIATGSRRFAQIAPTTPLQTDVCPVAGSVGKVLDWLKSPTRSRAVGTIAVLKNVLVVWRRPEYVPKKNVLSCAIGPPIVPPNWLRLSGGGGRHALQSFAVPFLEPPRSKTQPLRLLVYGLVVTLVISPGERRAAALLQ